MLCKSQTWKRGFQYLFYVSSLSCLVWDIPEIEKNECGFLSLTSTMKRWIIIKLAKYYKGSSRTGAQFLLNICTYIRTAKITIIHNAVSGSLIMGMSLHSFFIFHSRLTQFSMMSRKENWTTKSGHEFENIFWKSLSVQEGMHVLLYSLYLFRLGGWVLTQFGLISALRVMRKYMQ